MASGDCRRLETAKRRYIECGCSLTKSGKSFANDRITLQAPKPPSDALQALETTTALIVSEIMREQGSGISSGGIVSMSSPRITVHMPARTVTLSELQRLKRQFVTMHKKAITLGATESGDVDWSEQGIAAKFGHYLEERLGAN